MSYIQLANSLPMYLLVGVSILFIASICVVLIRRSYKAGIALGMDSKVLKGAITSSAAFTVLPSVSILLGVIALSGSLGVPASWLRLSVVGNLQYEATVANIAAENMGTVLDSSVLTMNNLVTILMVMTVGIIWGCLLSVFTLKSYSSKLKLTAKKSGSKGGFAGFAMTGMMIGLCATFIGSYIAAAFVKANSTPLITLLVSGACMALFDTAAKKTGSSWLDNFSLSLSMLLGMAAAVLVIL
ncbi:MAG: DUF5058 family protein [Bullifex sp.]